MKPIFTSERVQRASEIFRRIAELYQLSGWPAVIMLTLLSNHALARLIFVYINLVRTFEWRVDKAQITDIQSLFCCLLTHVLYHPIAQFLVYGRFKSRLSNA